MLTLSCRRGSRDCDGSTRRDFIRAGGLAVGGLSLPWLLRAKAHAAESGFPDFVKDKAVVVIFLAGGASHIETFNPNMGEPEPYRSVTGEVKTAIPGVTFGATFPLLAERAKQGVFVRSHRHPVGAHAQAISHVLTAGTDPNGRGEKGFSMGSAVSALRGANHPASGMPTYSLLTWPHKDGQYNKERGRVVTGSRSGDLGPTFVPFTPEGKGPAFENMELRLPNDRLDDRRALLRKLDSLKRHLDDRDATHAPDQFEAQAVNLLTGGANSAFDITGEDAKLVERYDTSKFKCGKKVFQESILGTQLLMTRRLIEAGCGFVTVQNAGWDMHADGNNPGVEAGVEMLGRPLDKALSAFLDDLEDRGMADKVLTIVTGDFGRTPKINKKGGRDHWARLCTLALFGGGLNTGQIIGRSDKQNGQPATEPVTLDHLMGTVLHTMFDVGELRLKRGIPSELMTKVEKAEAIPGVL